MRELATAKLRALDRLETVLRSHFETVIDSTEGVPVPVPQLAEQYAVLAGPRDLDEWNPNAEVAVAIFPATDEGVAVDATGGTTYSTHQIEWPVAIHLRFTRSGNQPNWAGRLLTQVENHARMAFRYEAALINLVDQYAPNGDDILDVQEMTKSRIDTDYNEGTAEFIHVHTEFLITQMVERRTPGMG